MSEVKKPVFQPNPVFAKEARIKNMDEYNALMDKAKENYEGFWGDYANEKLDWIEPFTNVLDESNAPFVKWFDGGKLNVAA
ncbi:MAG: acetyl-coenzyme A synthetase N-terminal domain-containing protein, partial [Sulfurimonadaceae bacterium]